ncbi:MAG: SGNH/GDSL hydrolase family protein [Pseudomonadota bacterium]
MIANWLRRTAVLGVCAAAALLSACGSSTVESAISPKRFFIFGDGVSDLGQNGSRYTVNDGTINNWTQQLANSYGVSVAPVSAGGTSYAAGNARITAKPDAAGVSSTQTVTEQISSYLASNVPLSSDVLVVSAGTADVVADFAAFRAGTLTSDQFLANATQEGKDLAAQVHRLVAAGAKYVLVTGTYDLSRSPLALLSNQPTILSAASTALNNALLINIADLGVNVLYVDAAYYFNLITGLPGSYGFNDGISLVCNSADPGAGIGIGAGQVNSALCTPFTIRPGLDYSVFIFADALYFTPQAQRLFGSYAYDRLHTRF